LKVWQAQEIISTMDSPGSAPTILVVIGLPLLLLLLVTWHRHITSTTAAASNMACFTRALH
jgi:hypothetical protein